MPDRGPFTPAEQRAEGDRNIGEHEQRERECIQDPPGERNPDMLSFTDHRDQTDNEQCQIHISGKLQE